MTGRALALLVVLLLLCCCCIKNARKTRWGGLVPSPLCWNGNDTMRRGHALSCCVKNARRTRRGGLVPSPSCWNGNNVTRRGHAPPHRIMGMTLYLSEWSVFFKKREIWRCTLYAWPLNFLNLLNCLVLVSLLSRPYCVMVVALWLWCSGLGGWWLGKKKWKKRSKFNLHVWNGT